MDGAEVAPGHPEVLRLVAPNPGPMTLAGTNTYVVEGGGGVWVVDPGPDIPEHLDRVRATAEARGVIEGVVLTHSHADHSAGVEALGAPLVWGSVSDVDESSASPGSLPRQDPPAATVGPFDVLPTPGHAPDHVCFVLGDVCLCGDLVLGEGSSIVPPAAWGGSLAAYMNSLEIVRDLHAELLCPGHGSWITDPEAKIDHYAEHRLDRERRLVAALEAGERSRSVLLADVWDDVPEVLRAAAGVAMQAHLEKLSEEGRLPADVRD